MTENEDGYLFQYEREYLSNPNAKPVSLTLPVREEPF
jgi:serine/threonine-protein kinase HipA